MTEDRLVLAELLEKAGDGDFLRAVAEAVLQLLMESDVEGLIGAGRYERSGAITATARTVPRFRSNEGPVSVLAAGGIFGWAPQCRAAVWLRLSSVLRLRWSCKTST